MSSKKAKEAYLRKYGRGERSPRASHDSIGYSSAEEELPQSPGRQPQFSLDGKEGEKSWAQKRKENVLARATGARSPKEADELKISLAAVQFAAK